MTELNSQQKQLLFDYCLGLISEEVTAEAEQLIASNEQAAEIHSKLKTALLPLKTLESDTCPDSLAEGTVWRLNNIARSGQLQLEQLLADEQAKSITDKSRFWKNLGEIVAAAAVIVFVAGVIIAPLNLARQKSRQQAACLMQLQRIGQGINSYSSDHDGKLPAVATATGAPWWKVGYQGKENYSNTRHIWLLPKGGYVNPADFICPGRRDCQILQLAPSEVLNYNDFPSRKHITYSFRIRCVKAADESPGGKKVLIADLSPLFEKLPDDYSKPLKLQLTKDLLSLNSINHNRRGQNVLFCDGSAAFVKTRQIDTSKDDIFTVQGTNTYEGVEVPARETDAFLAP